MLKTVFLWVWFATALFLDAVMALLVLYVVVML